MQHSVQGRSMTRYMNVTRLSSGSTVTKAKCSEKCSDSKSPLAAWASASSCTARTRMCTRSMVLTTCSELQISVSCLMCKPTRSSAVPPRSTEYSEACTAETVSMPKTTYVVRGPEPEIRTLYNVDNLQNLA